MKIFTTFAFAGALLLAGCGKHDESGHAAGGGHHHEAPHGGTLVELGEHEFNVEFIAAAGGVLNAYVLDAHAENFVRLPVESFQVTAKVAGREETLTFKPVANSATGETAGNTSQFQTQAEWLKTAAGFDGVLKELAVGGKTYASVAFKLPK
ncbi:MAG: hypothetical protein HY301_06700 [Verrucomicrobia bacterium]|nr:hypothetical protein [Verrucomicrobiota bacterium]